MENKILLIEHVAHVIRTMNMSYAGGSDYAYYLMNDYDKIRKEIPAIKEQMIDGVDLLKIKKEIEDLHDRYTDDEFISWDFVCLVVSNLNNTNSFRGIQKYNRVLNNIEVDIVPFICIFRYLKEDVFIPPKLFDINYIQCITDSNLGYFPFTTFSEIFFDSIFSETEYAKKWYNLVLKKHKPNIDTFLRVKYFLKDLSNRKNIINGMKFNPPARLPDGHYRQSYLDYLEEINTNVIIANPDKLRPMTDVFLMNERNIITSISRGFE